MRFRTNLGQEIDLTPSTTVVVKCAVLDRAGIEYDSRDADENGELVAYAEEVPQGQWCRHKGIPIRRV
jgi:hypothetical protein